MLPAGRSTWISGGRCLPGRPAVGYGHRTGFVLDLGVTGHHIRRRHSHIRVVTESRSFPSCQEGLVWNDPERSRARLYLARRSGPLTARSVPRQFSQEGKDRGKIAG